MYGKIDEVYGDKMSIDIRNVFDGVMVKSFILFEGRPGSGKTTLMIKVSCEWAKGKLFRSKLVFLVQLRHLDGKENVDLCDLIRIACTCKTLSPEDICGLTSYIKGTLGASVVFILDGFDEYRIAGNFRGRKLSRIGRKGAFRGENFRGTSKLVA